MRSNDVIFGLTYDITYFTQIQKYIAFRLGIPTGSYTHFATSMHMYDRDYEKVKQIAYGTLDTKDEIIDVDLLLCDTNKQQLTDYIDNEFVSREDFTEKCKKLGIIRRR